MPEDTPTPPPQPPIADTPQPPPAAAAPAPPAAAAPPSTPPYAYGPPYAQASPYAAYPQPPRRRHSAWFWVAIIGGSFAAVALLLTAMIWGIVKSVSGDTSTTSLDGLGGSKIGVIDIDGTILDADKINTQIRKFGDDSSIKAIILHINSPGGGAAASQEIYNEVLSVRREKNKKIVASIDSVGASGAYYVASGCDKIYASNASVVGSIGVIMEWTNYGDLLKWAKMKSVVIHAGTLKDAGDPTREMTPAEQAYFQSVVDNMYGQFIHDVAAGRHTSDDKVRPLATGQVWTGQQSLPLGLIDKIGGFRVALIDTARSVGISGEPTIARPPADKKGLLALLSDDSDEIFPTPSKLLDQAPGFYFMWR